MHLSFTDVLFLILLCYFPPIDIIIMKFYTPFLREFNFSFHLLLSLTLLQFNWICSALHCVFVFIWYYPYKPVDKEQNNKPIESTSITESITQRITYLRKSSPKSDKLHSTFHPEPSQPAPTTESPPISNLSENDVLFNLEVPIFVVHRDCYFREETNRFLSSIYSPEEENQSEDEQPLDNTSLLVAFFPSLTNTPKLAVTDRYGTAHTVFRQNPHLLQNVSHQLNWRYSPFSSANNRTKSDATRSTIEGAKIREIMRVASGNISVSELFEKCVVQTYLYTCPLGEESSMGQSPSAHTARFLAFKQNKTAFAAVVHRMGSSQALQKRVMETQEELLDTLKKKAVWDDSEATEHRWLSFNPFTSDDDGEQKDSDRTMRHVNKLKHPSSALILTPSCPLPNESRLKTSSKRKTRKGERRRDLENSTVSLFAVGACPVNSSSRVHTVPRKKKTRRNDTKHSKPRERMQESDEILEQPQKTQHSPWWQMPGVLWLGNAVVSVFVLPRLVRRLFGSKLII
ncbi:hypothetical protein BLNAU_11607 [Blattamonas nauphoetae]|uniref:Uncharacterized protein n=1 Tax=Blattamonas nauphoetae TaxID=2049346 RepID=A0ABQ9XRQ1_9EUKA|nr:hypothetical protein BLNAU_11607 [Blattamonas nauphoetae]